MVNQEDMKGNTALHFAIEGRYKAVVKELIKQGWIVDTIPYIHTMCTI